MNSSSKKKLYNIFFPIWILWLIPTTWLIVIPLNFILDFLVLFVSMKLIKIENTFVNSKKSIFRVFISGFLADFVSSALLICLTILFSEVNSSSLVLENLFRNPFLSVKSFLIMMVFVVLAAILIYIFNYYVSFRKLNIESLEKKKLALSLAIFTAPYFFLLPTEMLYNILS